MFEKALVENLYLWECCHIFKIFKSICLRKSTVKHILEKNYLSLKNIFNNSKHDKTADFYNLGMQP